MLIDNTSGFWNGKKVLVTGHTGFKGSWLSIWLREMGAEVIGYALAPNTEIDNFVLSKMSEKMIDIRGDIRDASKLEQVFEKYKPEIVFHLAAQPLVRKSYDFPKETYEVNVIGTLNVLENIRKSDFVKSGIMITTDKCYDNKEQIWGYRETDALGGYDPYSSSKACAEILIASYRNSYMNPTERTKHGKAVASARAGNVIGGGDWSKDRLIPDSIRSLENNEPIKIRNPKAVRPWQHVLEPLSGYLTLAYKMDENPVKYSDSWNFGPDLEAVKNVWQICEMVISEYGSGKLEDVSTSTEPHEAELLALDSTKAKLALGWATKFSIEKAVAATVDWYKKYRADDAYNLCIEDIKSYINLSD